MSKCLTLGDGSEAKLKISHFLLKCNVTWLILEKQCRMLFISGEMLFNSIEKIRSSIVLYMENCVVDGDTLSS